MKKEWLGKEGVRKAKKLGGEKKKKMKTKTKTLAMVEIAVVLCSLCNGRNSGSAVFVVFSGYTCDCCSRAKSSNAKSKCN
jgi:hypothetical protein